MMDARGLKKLQLHEILKPYRKSRDNLSHATKLVLLEKAQSLGLVGEKTPDPQEPPCSSSQRYIPLRNKNETVVDWCLIDADDYELVSQYSWRLAVRGMKKYAVNNLEQMMHCLLLGRPLEAGEVIDHIDGNGLNNTRSNLRFASRTLNSQNKKKKAGTSSRYYGVHRSTWGWAARHAESSLGYYDTEEKAAYAYDVFITEKFAGKGKINGITKPESYVPYVKRQLTCASRGVRIVQDGRIYASYWDKTTRSHVPLGYFATEKDASNAYEAFRAKVEEEEERAWATQPILRNADGVAVIPVTVKGVKNAEQALVDDDLWHFFMKRTWHLDDKGYVSALRTRMHTEVLKVSKGEIVDHRKKRLDNRRSSLMRGTYGTNNHNRAGNTNTGYKGVYHKRPSWRTEITYKKQLYRLGYYNSPQIAAYAYDCAARQLYGDAANHNDVAKPDGYEWDADIMRLIQST